MSDPPAGLLVVGDVVTDVLARHAGPLPPDADLPAEITVRAGGSAANTAAWAATLGADVRLLARAGADAAQWHAARLIEAGVRPHLRVDVSRPTAVIIVMVDAAGERTMLTQRGAGARLGPDDWDDALLEGAAWLHVSGYVLFAEPGRALARRAIAAARARGASVSVDPASAGDLRRWGPGRFVAATEGVDVLLPNRDEAAVLTGTADPREAAARLSGRYGLVVCKLGGDGALAARAGRVIACAAAEPVRAIDSTGAGDAFAAGFLTARLAGMPVADALAAGCRAGARAVTGVGGRPPVPSPE